MHCNPRHTTPHKRIPNALSSTTVHAHWSASGNVENVEGDDMLGVVINQISDTMCSSMQVYCAIRLSTMGMQCPSSDWCIPYTYFNDHQNACDYQNAKRMRLPPKKQPLLYGCHWTPLDIRRVLYLLMTLVIVA